MSKSGIIGGILAVLAIGGVVWAVIALAPRDSEDRGATSTTASPLPGPTETTSAEPSPGASPSQATQPGKKSAQIFVAWSGASQGGVGVNGYVSNITEAGGVCTLTVSGPSGTVSSAGAAMAGPTVTMCPNLVAGSALPAGTYSATLSYESAGFAGASGAQTVEVP